MVFCSVGTADRAGADIWKAASAIDSAVTVEDGWLYRLSARRQAPTCTVLKEGKRLELSTSEARIPTAHAGQYLTQLCKHFGHKLEVEHGDGKGLIRFPEAQASLAAAADTLVIKLDAANDEIVARMQGVVERHLDRFAFRELPLAYNWSAIA